MSDNTMRPIETLYGGYRFRSRTEARWAVFFDELCLKYEYETQGFDLGDGLQYLPDFWLPELDAWFEVKGVEPTEVELRKCRMLCAQSKKIVLIAVGAPKQPEAERDQIIFIFWDELDSHPDTYGDNRGNNDFRVGFWFTTGDELNITNKSFSHWAECWPDIERNWNDITRAYTTAAHARFEHGETPQHTPPRKERTEVTPQERIAALKKARDQRQKFLAERAVRKALEGRQ